MEDRDLQRVVNPTSAVVRSEDVVIDSASLAAEDDEASRRMRSRMSRMSRMSRISLDMLKLCEKDELGCMGWNENESPVLHNSKNLPADLPAELVDLKNVCWPASAASELVYSEPIDLELLKRALEPSLATHLCYGQVIMGLAFTNDPSLAKEKCCARKIQNNVLSLLKEMKSVPVPCMFLSRSEQMHFLKEIVGIADQFFASVVTGFDTSPHSDAYFASMIDNISMHGMLNLFIEHAATSYSRDIASDLFAAVSKLANPPSLCVMSNKEQHKKGRTAARKAKAKAAKTPPGSVLADSESDSAHRRYQHDTPKQSVMDNGCAGLRSERLFGVCWEFSISTNNFIDSVPGDSDYEEEKGYGDSDSDESSG